MSNLRPTITAWRSWFVSNGYLVSCTQKFVWPPRLIIPASDDGYYSFKTEAQALGSDYHIGGVLGELLIWGHVHEHQEGYRSQFAYPKTIYYFDDTKEIDILGLSVYGVPVVKHHLTRKELTSEADKLIQLRVRQQKQQQKLFLAEQKAKRQALIQRAKDLGLLDQIEEEANRRAERKLR